MVIIKTAREISLMKDACRISANALRLAGEYVKPGVTTREIDEKVREYIEKQGATPSFLGYGGFPASACISVNDVVIHGIPSKEQVLQEGDIVSVDVGAFYNGYHGDNAYTYACGKVSENAEKLMDATRIGLEKGIEAALAGNRVGDIGSAVQKYVEDRGYSVVRDFVGHGVGADLHEDPSVPNFGTPGHGPRLLPGMTIAIEPMINCGTHEIEMLPDGWTVLTRDRKLSAHFEHTVAITDDGCEVLTLPADYP